MGITDLEDNNIIPCFTGEETTVKYKIWLG